MSACELSLYLQNQNNLFTRAFVIYTPGIDCTMPTMFCFVSFIQKRSLCSQNKTSTKSKKSLIWVYDILDLSLVKEAPFQTKFICGKTLGINRKTVAAYLDTAKLFKHRLIFSSSPPRKPTRISSSKGR